MAAETQYTANTGIAQINTANSNLDGTTGTVTDILTAASNGTLIKTVTIKAITNTSYGMVRLFAYDGTNTKLITEVSIPAVTKSATEPAFQVTIPLNYVLEASGKLKATTEIGDTFIITAEGLNFAYYGSVRPESTKYTANNAFAVISTANSNLDGTGTLGTILTATSSATSKGTLLQSIVIKATGNTTPGMIRLYIVAAATAQLLMEIPVPAVTKSATAHSFSYRVDFGGRDFALPCSWVLKASTEKAEAFNVIAEGLDWTYPA